MKLSTREDIEASIEDVYKAVVDFDGFERQLLRRGVDVARSEGHPLDKPGMRWTASFDWRGRHHKVNAELVSIEPDEGYAIESKISGIECMSTVDLVPLSPSKTRLFVSLDVRPTTLSSRLFVHSLRLAKSSLLRRFKKRVASFAVDVQGRSSR